MALTKISTSMLKATGTPDSTTYLRGDGVWATPDGNVSSAPASSLTKIDLPMITTTGTQSASSFFRGDGVWSGFTSPIWVNQSGSIAIANEQAAFTTNLLAVDPNGLTLTYTVTSGALPSGLTLSTSGVLSGTTPMVTSNTVYLFTISASNGTQSTPQQFTMTVNNSTNEPPVWSTAAGDIGSVNMNSSFNYSLSATDPNSDPITYSVVSGTLPTGLTMSSLGVITGTAANVGTTTTSNFTIRATDSNSGTTDRAFSITVVSTVYLIQNSVRCRSAGSTYLSRTPSVTGNRQKFTISAWVKRGTLGVPQSIFDSYNGSGTTDSDWFQLAFTAADKLIVQGYNNNWRITTPVYRDVGAWYHVYCSVDTTTQTINLYVNGSQVTAFDTNIAIASNLLTSVNSGVQHRWGSINFGTYNYLDGYLSDCYLIDGAALTATSFGKFDTNGVWVPVSYVGQGNIPVYGPDTTQGQTYTNAGGFSTIANAFDGNDSTTTYPHSAVVVGTDYLAVQHSSAKAIQRIRIIFPTASYAWTSLKLQYSDNGSSWSDAGTVTPANIQTEQWFTFSNNGSHIYWRILANGLAYNSAAGTSIGTLSMYEATSTTSNYGTNGCHLEFKNASALGTDTSGITTTYNQNVPTGSVFGNMPQNGGNAAAFDGNTNKGYASCTTSLTTNTGYVGKAFASAQIINAVQVYGANNGGYSDQSPGNMMTLSVYGKATSPASATDGTLLGSLAPFADINAINPLTIPCSGASYQYVWLVVYNATSNAVGVCQVQYMTFGANTFTSNGFATSDQMVDTPTNNYCVLNPLQFSGTTPGTFTEGNLVGSSSNGSPGFIHGSIYVDTGKWYFEAEAVQAASGASHLAGVADSTNAYGVGYYSNGTKTGGGTVGAAWTNTNRVGIELDLTVPQVSFYLDGSLQNTYALTAGKSYSIWFYPASSSYSMRLRAQPSMWARTPTTGFIALCTANLPAVFITKPKSYHNEVLWTGNGSTQSLTGVGHQPDLVWIKGRSGAARNNVLADSVRGANLQVIANSTAAEADTLALGITSFNADGFSIGAGASYNTNTETYVGWCWKKGSTPGFDIQTFTTPAAGTSTFSHSLGAVPAFMIMKSRTDGTGNWVVWHKSFSNTAQNYIVLNTTGAVSTSATIWNNAAPTSSLVNYGTSGLGVSSGYVAYLWAEVPGFSKFGSYTGNASTDGTFVYLGFQPAFIMMKRTDSTGPWLIEDGTVNATNPGGNYLIANLSNAESTAEYIDFTSNGFKIRVNSTNENASGGTYIYAAFACNPFGGSNVSPATAR